MNLISLPKRWSGTILTNLLASMGKIDHTKWGDTDLDQFRGKVPGKGKETVIVAPLKDTPR